MLHDFLHFLESKIFSNYSIFQGQQKYYRPKLDNTKGIQGFSKEYFQQIENCEKFYISSFITVDS